MAFLCVFLSLRSRFSWSAVLTPVAVVLFNLSCDYAPHRRSLHDSKFQDFVAACMIIQFIRTEMEDSFEKLVSGTNFTSGIGNCDGFSAPVEMFVPNNLTAYQLSQGFAVTSTAESNTSLANCTSLTADQQYWGLVFFNPSPGKPVATDGLTSDRYHYFVVNAIWLMLMATCGGGYESLI